MMIEQAHLAMGPIQLRQVRRENLKAALALAEMLKDQRTA
jgi:hypothetical protein